MGALVSEDPLSGDVEIIGIILHTVPAFLVACPD
jgi:hypothetical protein